MSLYSASRAADFLAIGSLSAAAGFGASAGFAAPAGFAVRGFAAPAGFAESVPLAAPAVFRAAVLPARAEVLPLPAAFVREAADPAALGARGFRAAVPEPGADASFTAPASFAAPASSVGSAVDAARPFAGVRAFEAAVDPVRADAVREADVDERAPVLRAVVPVFREAGFFAAPAAVSDGDSPASVAPDARADDDAAGRFRGAAGRLRAALGAVSSAAGASWGAPPSGVSADSSRGEGVTLSTYPAPPECARRARPRCGMGDRATIRSRTARCCAPSQ
jgi:hypothetical protein